MKRFFGFVEIKTKITSVFPFFMTLALLFYQKNPIRFGPTALFFLSMFVFDLTTTAINNYIDSRTNDQVLQYKRGTAKAIILGLLLLSTASGLYLVFLSDAVVLLVGALCFVCGVLYTYGPVPISRTPLGEALSGVFYGLFIPFLLLYINKPTGWILTLSLSSSAIDAHIAVLPLLTLVLFAAIPTCLTANIMLANNICDVKKDILVKRFTLPYYLGESSLNLFAALNYLCYAAILAMVVLRMVPPLCLLALASFVIVQRNIRIFYLKQIKEETFIVSIQNYVVIMGSLTVLLFLSGLLRL